MAYTDFTQFPVWNKAFELILSVYKLTKDFPSEEMFGLVSDMKRAAHSVAHNIAEGFGRAVNKDKTRFYKMARGSAHEVMSQLLISEALSFMNKENTAELVGAYKIVVYELNKMIKSLEKSKK